MQARNLTTNVPKIIDLKSSSDQIFSKNCRRVPLCYCRAELIVDRIKFDLGRVVARRLKPSRAIAV